MVAHDSPALLLLRFFVPAALLLASCLSFTLPSSLYFVAFLVQYFRPAYAVTANNFPLVYLLLLLIYSALWIISHITLAILVARRLIRPQDYSVFATTFAIPRYDRSAWQGVRLLIPGLVVLVTSCLTLLSKNQAGERYISKRLKLLMKKKKTAEAESDSDDSFRSDDNQNRGLQTSSSESDGIRETKPGQISVTRFTRYMAGRGGIFWSTIGCAFTGLSYSSLLTLVFLLAFAFVVVAWAFHVNTAHQNKLPRACLIAVRYFRIFVILYLLFIISLQVPWFTSFIDNLPKEKQQISNVLKLVGFVRLDTKVPQGWAYVTGFCAAIATYIFTGIFVNSLHDVIVAEKNEDVLARAESASESTSDHAGYKLSYYETQFLHTVLHLSSLGLLTWSLVFPGILTLPMMFSALAYFVSKRVRHSPSFDRIITYAVLLQIAHFLYVSVVTAFNTKSNGVIRLLGLRQFNPQFSMNLVQSLALALFCTNMFSKRYINRAIQSANRNSNSNEPLGFTAFVRNAEYSATEKKQRPVYSTIRLITDQLSLASLYISAGVQASFLNSVFLVFLSVLCFCQAFGMFRHPKIMRALWGFILVYSIIFLLITCTACRAISEFVTCNLYRVGIVPAVGVEVVAYTATVVFATIQMQFTWCETQGTKEDADSLSDYQSQFWCRLRKYFLFVAYGALLLYPLLYPANFLSYGYVLFLAISILVELLGPSLRRSNPDVRPLIRRYWVIVVVFTCVAMLSRYFALFKWAKEKTATLLYFQQWVFGLKREFSSFHFTTGDASLLIIVSLQGRLFAIDSLLSAQRGKNRSVDRNAGSENTTIIEDSGGRQAFEDSGNRQNLVKREVPFSTSHSRNVAFDGDSLGLHRRVDTLHPHSSTESLNTAGEVAQDNAQASSSNYAGQGLMSAPLLRSVPETSRVDHRLQESDAPRSIFSPAGISRSEAQGVTLTDQARIAQFAQKIRNWRMSIPVMQTEKFLHNAYNNILVMARSILLGYSHVLEACAILAAAVWLPGFSLFGAIYIILGCILLLAEQPFPEGSSALNAEIEKLSKWRVSKTHPVVLAILSFSLMSGQYLFSIIFHIAKPNIMFIFEYVGLQEPLGARPIDEAAMLAHVLVFVTAFLQRVAVQWAASAAMKINADVKHPDEFGSILPDPLQSRDALAGAIRIGSVLPGVGGPSQENNSRMANTLNPSTPDEFLGYSNTHRNRNSFTAGLDKKSSLQISDTEISSSRSNYATSEEIFDKSGKRTTSATKRLTVAFVKSGKFLWQLAMDIRSLISPFWSRWGFDITFMYLVIGAAFTRTLFSVVYVTLVMAVSGFRRDKVSRHWHHITLLLACLVLLQYGLTLGIPTAGNQKTVIEGRCRQNFECWSFWLYINWNKQSRERKYDVTFAFLAVICASMTLNSVSPGPRGFRFWFLKKKKQSSILRSDSSNDSRANLDSQANLNPDMSPRKAAIEQPLRSDLPSEISPKQNAHAPNRGAVEETLSPCAPFEGLGLGRALTNADATFLQVRSMDQIRSGRGGSDVHSSSAAGQPRLPLSSLGHNSNVHSTSSSEDFTKRPISLKNMIKLNWMRLVTSIVQLLMFAIAVANTNLLSGILLLFSYFFLFQFTNVAAKKSLFLVVRFYVLTVIFVLVVYQAPFEVPHSWLKYFGLIKVEKEKGIEGAVLLYSMVSLWLLCQIQARIFESSSFKFVEQFGEEDAKVRFKRAVHEHNTRKYEYMLGRNKNQRSRQARQARLKRLHVLKEKDRSVDALYKVCVEDEMTLLKTRALERKNGSHPFSSHVLQQTPSSITEKVAKDRGALNCCLRFLLRGRGWRKYYNHPLYAEIRVFMSKYSAWSVYATMLLAAVVNPNELTVLYPLFLFLYLILEQPRPPKKVWQFLMIYVCIVITGKYIARAAEPCAHFFLNRQTHESICILAGGVFFDILILLALLWHRTVLYYRGLWDLKSTEEDMLLTTKIRGRREKTDGAMSMPDIPKDEEDTLALDQPANILWARSSCIAQRGKPVDAKQQCSDTASVLERARQSLVVPQFHSDFSENSESVVLKQVETTGGVRRSLHHRPTPSSFLRKSQSSFIPSVQVGARPFAPGPSMSFGGLKADVSGAEISRFSSLRLGSFIKTQQPEDSDSENLTDAQYRVQQSLEQSKVMPRRSTAKQSPGNLSLFRTNSQGGPFSGVTNHFAKLTKEHEHKAVGDYYILIFLVDFISFVYVAFGFTAIFGQDPSAKPWWVTNFIETKQLLTLLGLFAALVFDRVVYLTRSMKGKLVLQYLSVVIYHVVIFMTGDSGRRNIRNRFATKAFYLLRCVYFLLSGLQIRNGFPTYTTAQFLLRNYNTPGIVIFEIYNFIPFLWLMRTLLDWAVVPTSLEIFQYFRFVDIYIWLYRNRAVNTARGSFRRILGQQRRWLPRVYQGFGIFSLCVIALFFPFLFFSVFNPFFEPRQPLQATLQLSLLVPIYNLAANSSSAFALYSRTSAVGASLSQSDIRDLRKRDPSLKITVRDREKVYLADFGTISDEAWSLPSEEERTLSLALRNYTDIQKPKLNFEISAKSETQEFRLEAKTPLTKSQSETIGNSIASKANLGIILNSTLPKHAVLESGSSKFSRPPGSKEDPTKICLRHIYNRVGASNVGGESVWSLQVCEACVCGSASLPIPNQGRSRHFLQVAQVSSVQLGGSTIITLYAAILFTLASFMRGFFSDKRLIIPYIDMPYTLHLYQLVLDIVYARQDNDLLMEEILYNGLTDVYRDQHTLTKWSGERALKIPREWWVGSEDEEAYHCYPSFAETLTEPYLTRKVE